MSETKKGNAGGTRHGNPCGKRQAESGKRKKSEKKNEEGKK